MIELLFLALGWCHDHPHSAPKHQTVVVSAAGFGNLPTLREALWSPLAFAFFTRKRGTGKGREGRVDFKKTHHRKP